MLLRALLFWLLAMPALAAPAKVTSGEHEGFTRLVVELAQPMPWQVGRSSDGYELRFEGDPSQFDLSKAFALIGRGRIASLSGDDATGILMVTLGCACHVMAFEFRPGIIVMDLKDGPPPINSPFETTLTPTVPTSLPKPDPVPAPDPKDVSALSSSWMDAALGTQAMPSSPVMKEPAIPVRPIVVSADKGPAADLPKPRLLDVGLGPMHDDLMREIARGAADGVVNMQLGKQSETGVVGQKDTTAEQSRVGLGALGKLPHIRVEGAMEPAADLAGEGAQCPTDAQLDFAAWGDDRPIWEQISEVRQDLTGEFDVPNPEAVSKAIKFHLFIGFGHEAIAIAASLGSEETDTALWLSLGHLLDDMPDPEPAFAGFDQCESAAALWALLGRPVGEPVQANFPAIQRSFSALPSGLRQTIGPRLMDRLVALDAADAVNVVSSAIKRAGAEGDRGIALIEAEVAARSGEFAEAKALLKPLLDDPGPNTPEAVVLLIEGQAALGLPVPEETVIAIEAFAMERKSGPEAARFERAYSLALALSGKFKAAFDVAPAAADHQADLWRLLAKLGDDATILEQASLNPADGAPVEASAVASVFSERFLALGLPAQAQIWLSAGAEVDRLLAAKIAIANTDGRSALVYLEGMGSPEAATLRTEANFLNGDNLAVAADLAAAGDFAGETAALARAQDWASLQEKGQAQWKAAASTLAAKPAEDPLGPLAEARALADQANQTGAAVRALLGSVPVVEISAP